MGFKRLLIPAITLLFLLTMTMVAFGAPTVYLDGQQLTFTDTQPIIDDGRTLVPLRAIFETIGATVTWDQNTQTATAVKGSTTVVLQIGSTSPTINGQVKQLDVPAKIVDGRTLAPLRFVGEAFGGTVDWNDTTQTITISSTAVSQPAGSPPPIPVTSQGAYVGSTKSDKYHLPSCRYAKKIEWSNEIWFENKEEAETAGYEPCGVCKP